MKLLITGATGLLGSKLVEDALANGHDVISLCNEHPIVRGDVLRVDLRRAEEVRKALVKTKPDAVIHTASITDVDLCERNPTLAMDTNGKATGTIAQACSELNSFLVYVSTDYVFDGLTGSYKEENRTNPINVYGSSKLLGEQLTSNLARDSCIARTSVIFGWGREYRPNFATWLLGKLLTGQNVQIINGQYASPTLNTCLARMLLEVTVKRITGILHVAGAERVNRYEFALRLAREFGYDPKLLVPTTPDSSNWYAKRPNDSSLNVEKGIRLLDVKPCSVDEELRAFKLEREEK